MTLHDHGEHRLCLHCVIRSKSTHERQRMLSDWLALRLITGDVRFNDHENTEALFDQIVEAGRRMGLSDVEVEDGLSSLMSSRFGIDCEWSYE